ncbi:hypothetical protein TEK04_15040 [Klenkia sp. LSe6-5]|uniref:Uncharacterized protein n=1 Tax=Klenkia sesuvii TaxID=3103137 RepID=A0ABU8DW21_9ACTN
MDREEFTAELRKMVNRNNLSFVKEDQVLEALEPDLRQRGRFINILRSTARSGKNDVLLITDVAVTAIRTGMLSVKVQWRAPLDSITHAATYDRSVSGLADVGVAVEMGSVVHRFRFGLGDPRRERHLLAIAAHNADIAFREIVQAQQSSMVGAPSIAQPRVGRLAGQADADAVSRLLRTFASRTAGLSARTMVGRPFYEGGDLDDCMAVIPQVFPDLDRMRQAGAMITVSILEAAAESGLSGEDLRSVMGLDRLASSGLSAEQCNRAENLGSAACAFISQFDEDGESMWELWKKNPEVAGEFLSWHTVAWQRLASRDRVPNLLDL